MRALAGLMGWALVVVVGCHSDDCNRDNVCCCKPGYDLLESPVCQDGEARCPGLPWVKTTCDQVMSRCPSGLFRDTGTRVDSANDSTSSDTRADADSVDSVSSDSTLGDVAGD